LSHQVVVEPSLDRRLAAYNRLIATPTDDSRVELRASFDESRNGNQKIVAAEVYVETPPWRGGAA